MLLIFALLFLSARGQDSPFCPKPSGNVGICQFDPSNGDCLQDSDCTGKFAGQICCSAECGKRCVAPLRIIPEVPFPPSLPVDTGTCPDPPPLALTSCLLPITDSCNIDSDCEGNVKCCDHPCGKNCVPLTGIVDPFPRPPIIPIANRPGSCPVPASGFLVRCALIDACPADWTCPGTQKCCKGQCGKRCLDTVETKEGTCAPMMDSPCSSISDKCYEDYKCPANQKCCKTSCGNVCSDPLPSSVNHPGLCPYLRPGIVAMCAGSIVPPCEGDSECNPDEKCCQSLCGVRCVKAVRKVTKPGTCPNSPSSALIDCAITSIGSDACRQDGDCQGDNKCCDHPCGKYCGLAKTVPVVIKSGSCPVPASGYLVRCAFIDGCPGDSACPGTQKCCKGPCGKRCSDTVKTKEGTCAPMMDPSTCSSYSDKCYEDYKCPANQKCCKTSCGNVCSDPLPSSVNHPGLCPYLRPGIVAKCASSIVPPCEGDSECNPDEKCCRGLCGVRCVKAVNKVTKPGTCPNSPSSALIKCAITSIGSDACRQDGDCQGDNKCCDHPCGKYCGLAKTVPVVIKSGTCPKSPNPALVLCAKLNNKCEHDGNCDGNNKCCSHPCGRYCGLKTIQAPKPGNCPKTIQLFSWMPFLRRDQCSDDQDCSLTHKCCRQMFGNKCVDVQPPSPPQPNPTKPGVCIKMSPNIRYRCRRKRDFCSSDSSCRRNLKCCERPCGKRCRRPARQPPISFPPLPPSSSEQCPPLPPGTVNCFRFENDCKRDSNCTDGLKCCPTICGIGCVKPIPIFVKG